MRREFGLCLLEPDFAFAHAWRKWSSARNFPSVAGNRTGKSILDWVGKVRTSPKCKCGMGHGSVGESYVVYDDWTVDECLDLHADERASAAAWIQFGAPFLSSFQPQ